MLDLSPVIPTACAHLVARWVSHRSPFRGCAWQQHEDDEVPVLLTQNPGYFRDHSYVSKKQIETFSIKPLSPECFPTWLLQGHDENGGVGGILIFFLIRPSTSLILHEASC